RNCEVLVDAEHDAGPRLSRSPVPFEALSSWPATWRATHWPAFVWHDEKRHAQAAFRIKRVRDNERVRRALVLTSSLRPSDQMVAEHTRMSSGSAPPRESSTVVGAVGVTST